jgi:hypothetical protein
MKGTRFCGQIRSESPDTTGPDPGGSPPKTAVTTHSQIRRSRPGVPTEPQGRARRPELPPWCFGPITLHSVSSGFPRWWRLGLAFTEVLLAAGLIVAAVTEGGWYWWAGAIAAATLALINLSVYLRTERVRRRPPDL